MDKPPFPAALSGHDDLLARAAEVADRCAAHAARLDECPTHREADHFPAEEFRWLADAGLLAAALPREHRGGGLHAGRGTMRPLLELLKHVGRGSLPVGRIYEGHANALMLVALFGTPAQLARAADDVHAYRRIFGVWNAEEEGGVRLVDIGAGRYRMEGVKLFCSGAGHVTRPIVTGKLPGGGWQMCVLPMETVSPSIDAGWWQPMGMEATVSARVDFSGVELGPDDLLGAPDDYYRDPWFNGGAIRFAAVQLGGAEGLYDAARTSLQRMGRTDHPAQRQRFSEMAMGIESGANWLRGAATVWERPPEEAAQISAYAAMTRMSIEQICLDTIRGVERSVGARGLMRPAPFARLIRHLTMYLRQPAPDAVMERIGRYALDDPRPAHAHWPSRPR